MPYTDPSVRRMTKLETLGIAFVCQLGQTVAECYPEIYNSFGDWQREEEPKPVAVAKKTPNRKHAGQLTISFE